MRIIILLACAGLVTACGDGRDPEPMTDEEAIAAVEASQKVPTPDLVLQPIGFGDMETAGAFGFSCAFATVDAPDTILALAMRDTGFLKAEGELIRLAADKGSPETVAGSWSNYDGRAITFTLTLDDAGVPGEIETTTYPAQLTVRGPEGGVVYESSGSAECGV